MVRRGSPVRVRKRASLKDLQITVFRLLLVAAAMGGIALWSMFLEVSDFGRHDY